MTKDLWFLQELKEVLVKADEDLLYSPPPENKAMHKFATLNTKNPFGETDAADMVEEIRMQSVPVDDPSKDPAAYTDMTSEAATVGLLSSGPYLRREQHDSWDRCSWVGIVGLEECRTWLYSRNPQYIHLQEIGCFA